MNSTFKIVVSIFFLFLGSKTWAYSCPHNWALNPEAVELHGWLQSLKGLRDLQNCQLEITACDPAQPEGIGSNLGEVFIVDSANREVYLPVSFVKDKVGHLTTMIKTSPFRLNYVKYDRYFEAEFGRTEAYRLSIRLHSKTGLIRSVDLGTYSTHKKLNHANGNQSRWYNCGEE